MKSIGSENFNSIIHNGRLVVYLDVDDIHLMFYGVSALIHSGLNMESKIIDETPDFQNALDMQNFLRAYLHKELSTPQNYSLERDDMFGDVHFINYYGDSIFHLSSGWVRGSEAIPENSNLRLCIWDDEDRDEYLKSRKILEKEMQDESKGL